MFCPTGFFPITKIQEWEAKILIPPVVRRFPRFQDVVLIPSNIFFSTYHHYKIGSQAETFSAHHRSGHTRTAPLQSQAFQCIILVAILLGNCDSLMNQTGAENGLIWGRSGGEDTNPIFRMGFGINRFCLWYLKADSLSACGLAHVDQGDNFLFYPCP